MRLRIFEPFEIINFSLCWVDMRYINKDVTKVSKLIEIIWISMIQIKSISKVWNHVSHVYQGCQSFPYWCHSYPLHPCPSDLTQTIHSYLIFTLLRHQRCKHLVDRWFHLPLILGKNNPFRILSLKEINGRDIYYIILFISIILVGKLLHQFLLNLLEKVVSMCAEYIYIT